MRARDDLAGFQSAIGDEYEAFVLGAYIHSETSFSISKTGDHRCRFDSCNLGFIGVPKGTNPDKIAEELTAAWYTLRQGRKNHSSWALFL